MRALTDVGFKGLFAFRDTHVLLAEAEDLAKGMLPPGASHELACGRTQVVYEDPIRDYENPFWPWWLADFASCRACLDAIERVHDLAERRRVRAALCDDCSKGAHS